jgi:hypothetical protein
MRAIRSSGLEGGVEFKPPSLPLFYRCAFPLTLHFVFRRRDRVATNRDPWRHITNVIVGCDPRRRKTKKERNVVHAINRELRWSS